MTRAESLDETGCVRLVAAFWAQAKAEYCDGWPDALAWVEARGREVGGFDWWCDMAHADPAVVAEHLRAERRERTATR